MADGQRRQAIAARLHPPVEATAFLFFEILGAEDTTLPENLSEKDCQAIMDGLVAQCPEIAKAPQMLEAPTYAAYAVFDAQNAVRLHRLADETAAVWHDLMERFEVERWSICIRNAEMGSICRSGPIYLIRTYRMSMAPSGLPQMSGSLRPIFRLNGPGNVDEPPLGRRLYTL